MHLPNNTRLHAGSYKIIRFINSGGFGCTYEAMHTLLNQRVAIKEFFVRDICNRDEMSGCVSVGTHAKEKDFARLKEKFVDEARALHQMQHQGLVHVTDVFEENGTAYYVMDYVEGQSLAQIVVKRGALPEAEALRYIREVCAALSYVHSRNRLHLDIKPGNIMVDSNGRAVLIDFGASKHYNEATGEQTSTLLGINTPGYAPIEQMSCNFRTFTPATDIYSLGATFYKLLTGLTPPNSLRLLSGEEELKPLPGTNSAPVRKAVEASMQLKRKDRPQTIDEFLDILFPKTKNKFSLPLWGSLCAAVVIGILCIMFFGSKRSVPEQLSGLLTDSLVRTGVSEAAEVEQSQKPSLISSKVKDPVSVESSQEGNLVNLSVSGTANGHDYVDLGLSVLWAACNVGANSPEKYGDHFAWGEIEPKDEYTYENSKTYKKTMVDISGNPKYDAARYNWGGNWRMPNSVEMDELLSKCNLIWANYKGVQGFMVTSTKNGNSIFLPAGGCLFGTGPDGAEDEGYYWTSMPYGDDYRYAYGLAFSWTGGGGDWRGRAVGFSVRPVQSR